MFLSESLCNSTGEFGGLDDGLDWANDDGWWPNSLLLLLKFDSLEFVVDFLIFLEVSSIEVIFGVLALPRTRGGGMIIPEWENVSPMPSIDINGVLWQLVIGNGVLNIPKLIGVLLLPSWINAVSGISSAGSGVFSLHPNAIGEKDNLLVTGVKGVESEAIFAKIFSSSEVKEDEGSSGGVI